MISCLAAMVCKVLTSLIQKCNEETDIDMEDSLIVASVPLVYIGSVLLTFNSDLLRTDLRTRLSEELKQISTFYSKIAKLTEATISTSIPNYFCEAFLYDHSYAEYWLQLSADKNELSKSKSSSIPALLSFKVHTYKEMIEEYGYCIISLRFTLDNSVEINKHESLETLSQSIRFSSISSVASFYPIISLTMDYFWTILFSITDVHITDNNHSSDTVTRCDNVEIDMKIIAFHDSYLLHTEFKGNRIKLISKLITLIIQSSKNDNHHTLQKLYDYWFLLAKLTLQSEINSEASSLMQSTRNTYNSKKSSAFYGELKNEIYHKVSDLMSILEYLVINDNDSLIDVIPFLGWLCEIYSSYATIPDQYKQDIHPDPEKIQNCMRYIKKLSVASSSSFLDKLEITLKWKCCQDPELTLIRELANLADSIVDSPDVNVIKKKKRNYDTANDINAYDSISKSMNSSPMKSPQAMSLLSVLSTPDQKLIPMISSITSSKEKRRKKLELSVDSNEVTKLEMIDEYHNNGNNGKDDKYEFNQILYDNDSNCELNPVLDDVTSLLDDDNVHDNNNQFYHTNTNINENININNEHIDNNNIMNNTTTTNNANGKSIDVWGADVSNDLSKKFGLGF